MFNVFNDNPLHISLWIDDMREPPQDGQQWAWVKSVDQAKEAMVYFIQNAVWIDVIDMDHDAGDFASQGGDYIELLNWLEEQTCEGYVFHIHSMNPVGVERMRAVIEKNNWTLIE